MKTYSVLLVLFLSLISCQEENVRPADHFSGSWYFSDAQTPIEISFDAVKIGNGVYNFENRSVIHPAIPAEEQNNNQIKTYDQFEGGYGRIEITSRGYTYYKITLIYNRFTDEGLAVYDLQIDIPSEPFIVLTDRIFIRQ